MKASGTYQGWDTPSYVIIASPEEVMDLFLAIKNLQQLTGYENRRAGAWRKLLESMNASDFGFERVTTEVISRNTDFQIAI